MLVTPFDYQLKGAAQMDQSLEGPFKFFFLGDRMGMGKTLTTTLALWLKKDEPGMALVVAPASVCAQWVSDVHRYFDEVSNLARTDHVDTERRS
jgi:SNF2 family DNA or RNA helicase